MQRLRVHVHPGAKVPGVGGAHQDRLIVRVRARAVDGQATAEVLLVVAEAFNLRPRQVTLVRGALSRDKELALSCDATAFEQRRQELLSN